jgi:hypothetical protein
MPPWFVDFMKSNEHIEDNSVVALDFETFQDELVTLYNENYGMK